MTRLRSKKEVFETAALAVQNAAGVDRISTAED